MKEGERTEELVICISILGEVPRRHDEHLSRSMPPSVFSVSSSTVRVQHGAC